MSAHISKSMLLMTYRPQQHARASSNDTTTTVLTYSRLRSCAQMHHSSRWVSFSSVLWISKSMALWRLHQTAPHYWIMEAIFLVDFDHIPHDS
jgi:hypothetical protein